MACDTQHCVGCTAKSRNVLEGMLGDSGQHCGFDSLPVEPRTPLPAGWFARYSFAIVRRGYVIRQRTDAAGRTTAIDAVGPGCCFPLDRASSNGATSSVSGYAITRALVCLCDDETLQQGLRGGGQTAIQVHELDAEAIVRMERLADARGRPGAASKVAALLCTMADTLRPEQNNGAQIPSEFLQRDLAGLLSIRHESVCRVLREFTDSGLVAKDAEGLTLVDRARLDAI
jgi:CRP-like cAMP-binding protein